MAYASPDHNAGNVASVLGIGALLGRAARKIIRSRLEARGRRGNCYAASEALYHILGGKEAGWTPMRVGLLHPNGARETHWFIKHASGLILDPAVKQFDSPEWWPRPDYSKAIGSGFLTKHPSKRAFDLIQRLTWHTLGEHKPTRTTRGRRASAPALKEASTWTSRNSKPLSRTSTMN